MIAVSLSLLSLSFLSMSSLLHWWVGVNKTIYSEVPWLHPQYSIGPLCWLGGPCCWAYLDLVLVVPYTSSVCSHYMDSHYFVCIHWKQVRRVTFGSEAVVPGERTAEVGPVWQSASLCLVLQLLLVFSCLFLSFLFSSNWSWDNLLCTSAFFLHSLLMLKVSLHRMNQVITELFMSLRSVPLHLPACVWLG